ncbi:MAG: DUF547 domain-containing protein [Thermodesulfobacteriota bacterium]
MKPYIYIFPVFLFIVLAISNQGHAETQGPPDQLYKNVLQTYIQDGLVDYAGLKSNPEDLKLYLKQTSVVTKENFDEWTKDEQLAFLINLYNAQSLALVVENYPVKSIKDIATDTGGAWKLPIVNLFGELITLDALENEVIRKNYPDPRVHFALVCAALGCPDLINTPYEAKALDTQLEEQTKTFLMDSDKNSIDINQKILMLSPIFDWFKEDFSAKSGSVIEFVNPYYDNKTNKEFKIEYTNYDWSLNDQPTVKK